MMQAVSFRNQTSIAYIALKSLFIVIAHGSLLHTQSGQVVEQNF